MAERRIVDKAELELLLPEACYAKHPTTGETVLLRRFEAGYQPVTVGIDVEETNGLLGVTKEQELAMMGGSMFGWETAAADPRYYLARRKG